jgi:predicted transcriptional regulator
MPDSLHTVLSRRERQIMDVLFRSGRATAADVMGDLPG